ncbi:hypothetical protein LCGC14_1194900 [marine sediment metagenome]|uniref:Uncharacterized protein n=1 Tax=marine sediment metagenome TaxID=412755 RepID=A0A0F9LN47_9ZZZZ
MTNEETLKNILDKAVKNGLGLKSHRIAWEEASAYHKERWVSNLIQSKEYVSIIFSHEFAKAYWGDGYICLTCGQEGECDNCYSSPNYRSSGIAHLMQLALSTDRIKYLEKFL